VGVNAGRIFTEHPAQCSAESHLFVRVTKRKRVKRVIRNLRRLDLEHAPFKYDTAGPPSISKSELCHAYTSRKKEENK
jgi:hypothetical protein